MPFFPAQSTKRQRTRQTRTCRFSLTPAAATAAATAGLPLLFAAPATLPLLLCAARPAVAQDAPGDVEAARTSSLAEGLTLPQGAYRSTSRADIAKFADTLGTIARESEGSIGKVEVLVWRGGSDGPRKTISAFLSKAGYKLNERPAIKSGVSTITLFGAAQSVRTNNLLGNLKLVCPNCHALTDNYRGKNKKV